MQTEMLPSMITVSEFHRETCEIAKIFNIQINILKILLGLVENPVIKVIPRLEF